MTDLDRVTDLFEKWAAEENEHRQTGEYGLAEGLRVAIDDLRAAVHGITAAPSDHTATTEKALDAATEAVEAEFASINAGSDHGARDVAEAAVYAYLATAPSAATTEDADLRDRIAREVWPEAFEPGGVVDIDGDNMTLEAQAGAYRRADRIIYTMRTEAAGLLATARPDTTTEPPEWRIEGTWLVEVVGDCTCGIGGPHGHEPGCGREPVVDLSRLPGWGGEWK